MGEPDRGVARRGRSPDASERVQTFALLEVNRAPRRNVRHNHSDAHRYDDDKGEKKLDQCGPFLIHPLLTSSSGPKQEPDCCGESSHGNPVPVGLPYNFGNPAVSFPWRPVAFRPRLTTGLALSIVLTTSSWPIK